ncbi:MAG TPA: hypothetical protein VJ993_08100 [Woeseiaceae bacterium]|nr:hypothetical protein [Woeseiaceae bacterium]
MNTTTRRRMIAWWLPGLAFLASPSLAQMHPERIAELEEQVSALTEQLGELSVELDEAKEAEGLGGLRKDVEANKVAIQATQSATTFTDATSVTHLSGYASADYVSVENGPSAFVANFNPMFHFLYENKILWEAELEVVVEENGETEIGLEYTTVDWFLNDNLTLIAGKFLSPIGNFRQNLHPSWINKLPSAPPGFGHDGAAPISEVGVQLRGVAPMGNSRLNYTFFLGNGPKIEGEDGEIHAIEAEGFASDPDDEKVFGGRVAFLPIPSLELAVSGATGDAAVVEDDGIDVEGDPKRGYQVLGFDASYQWNNLDLRGEYVKQEVDPNPLSIAPEGGVWETWYAQAAYKFADGKWEGVARYTDFQSPHADDTQEQLALGINYLITPSAFLKFGYESNNGEPGEITDADRWILQIAYGY